MPRNIDSDRKLFHDVIGGRFRESLKKFFSTGKFVKARANNKGQMVFSFPKIYSPFIVYGDNGEGVGRGTGKPGDVIKKDSPEDNGPGDDEGEGTLISVDMEDLIPFLRDELELPDLKPKVSDTYEEVRKKYCSISITGPESLIHNRRTWLQALKRLIGSGEIDKLHYIPGYADPIKIICPINSDRRYRQYRDIKLPSSNAVIMFARDGSGSMNDERCEAVSDMCWWIDLWIRHFYTKVQRCYFWHDVNAQEVDEEKFYRYRYGGGTTCSSCLIEMAKQFQTRFPPEKWNIYCFYFTDGENQRNDNPVFLENLKTKFGPDVCNLFAITQVMVNSYDGSLKQYVDANLTMPNYKSVSIGSEETRDYANWDDSRISEEERNQSVKKAIKHLMGGSKKEASSLPFGVF